MRFSFEKSIRIVSDIISYCHYLGSTDYHIDMKLHDDVSVYLISTPVPDIPPKVLEKLKETLGVPRQREVEQNYWGLSGEAETDPELVLVGMMTDEVMVDYRDGVLTIMAKRYEGK